MKHYLIERQIPGVGGLSAAQFQGLAATSNLAIARLSGQAQWIESYIAANNTFCVYFAESADVLREHSRLAGFPITRINEIVTVIDPLTACRPLPVAFDGTVGRSAGAGS
ncbi:MAG TPA: DUF4242 domain-containing protein [Caulobacteraceae bacterium]|nr:DUF4242 domain-containing protein [Caulobacteraceae bacterium]